LVRAGFASTGFDSTGFEFHGLQQALISRADLTGGSDMSEPFLGQIQTFAFNFAPRGWTLCNGQVLAISQNTALFSLLGTTYGGNGQTTFQLPDLRGRLPMHWGQGPGLSDYTLGEVSGTQNQTLLVSNMPMHSHPLNGTTAAATTATPTGNLLATANGADSQGSPNTVQIYAPAPANTIMDPTSIGLAGNSIPFSIMQPYLVISFCIALNGIFPSRN
jgi:microcystin-dependent protein